MKILWICALPLSVQRIALENKEHGAQVAASWIVAHLPPPPEVELHIACLWPGGDQRKTVAHEGANFHLVPCPKHGRSLLLFQRDTTYFRSLFDDLRPDVVHGWGTEDCFGLVARRLAPMHHLIGIQGLITAYRKRVRMHARTFLTALTEKWTLARARHVVAESEYSIRAARPLCPGNAKFVVIEHPLRREFLAATPSDGTPTTVLFVGEIQKRKGITDALQAFARAAPPDWNLQIVGSGPPEEERSMRVLAERVLPENRFAHTRSCSVGELVRLMQASSVFLLPTRIDTGPTALKEALTMCLWPVCYDNSGPGEYIRKYCFGSLAIDHDVESLTETLRHVFDRLLWQGDRGELARRTRHDFSPATAWMHLRAHYEAIAAK